MNKFILAIVLLEFFLLIFCLKRDCKILASEEKSIEAMFYEDYYELDLGYEYAMEFFEEDIQIENKDFAKATNVEIDTSNVLLEEFYKKDL